MMENTAEQQNTEIEYSSEPTDKPSINLKTVSLGFLICLVFVAVGISAYFLGVRNGQSQPNEKSQGVMCTLDAKICPDGTAVGRTGPNCEFEECPAETVEPNNLPQGFAPVEYTLPKTAENEDQLYSLSLPENAEVNEEGISLNGETYTVLAANGDGLCEFNETDETKCGYTDEDVPNMLTFRVWKKMGQTVVLNPQAVKVNGVTIGDYIIQKISGDGVFTTEETEQWKLLFNVNIHSK